MKNTLVTVTHKAISTKKKAQEKGIFASLARSKWVKINTNATMHVSINKITFRGKKGILCNWEET
jgi:hypothetical protein